VLAVVLNSCDVFVAEVERVASPDGKVELVVSTAEAGATTGITYYVNLVAPRGEANLDTSVFVADKVAEVNVHWESPNKIVIQCGDARVFRYTNFWQVREVDNFQHIVRIGLSGCAD
jgi:hypothetical protein